MKAMVLAAGAGSRMGELTRTLPKPMLVVGGRPILEHILLNLARHGFTQVVLNLHHHPQVIRDHFGDGSALGLCITYLQEPRLLGTAGSVGNAAHLLAGEEPVLVHYGDVLTDQDLGAMLAAHQRNRAQATLLLHQRVKSTSLGVVDASFQVKRLLERPTEAERAVWASSWVNSGVYLLDASVLTLLGGEVPLDLPRDIFPPLIERGGVFGFPLSGYRCAIDTPERLGEARAVFSGYRSNGSK